MHERLAAGGQVIAADRRHRWTTTARAVKTRTTMAAKKTKAMMARVTRATMETSPREEGDDGHNNQLSTKVAAMVRTAVASNVRQCKMDGISNQDGWGSRKITIDSGSGNEQWQRNRQGNGETTAMGKAAQ